MPDYDPPVYHQDQLAYQQPDGPPGQQGYGDEHATSPHSRRTQPDLAQTQRAWSGPGWSEDPARASAGFEAPQPDLRRPTDAESVSDPAMMSFPSVPARNGPVGYR